MSPTSYRTAPPRDTEEIDRSTHIRTRATISLGHCPPRRHTERLAPTNRFLESKPAAVKADEVQQACPKCHSKDTTTAAKRPSANSYWRCLKCGEVWNPAHSVARQWWQR